MIENFLRRLLKSIAPSERHPERKLTYLNLEFTPVTDEHFESATFPSTLLELNLNGCREISEKTLMVLHKSCPLLTRLGKLSLLSWQPIRTLLELQDHRLRYEEGGRGLQRPGIREPERLQVPFRFHGHCPMRELPTDLSLGKYRAPQES